MANWKQAKPKRKYREDDTILEKLASVYGIDDLQEFMYPSEKSVHDPYLLQNIEDVRDKIIHAIVNNLKIVVMADIDADGITSCAMMYNYLKQFTTNLSYIHAQRSDGHGLHTTIKEIPKDTDLLIIVDSSTSENKACEDIRAMGVDIVIIDHHPPENENPHALIVNAQLCDYPNKELSGAGHVFKVIQVLDDRLGSGTVDELYDLAGVGIYADAMSMKDPENRYFVHQALMNIHNLGLHAILKVGQCDIDNLNSGNLGFTVGPFLNGASRLDKIELALECLTTDDPERAMELAKEIAKLNEQRKKEQAKWTKKFMKEVNPNDKLVVIVNNEITKGYTGLVANEMAGKLGKPVAILSDNDKGEFAGSFRSVGNYNLKSFLSTISQVSFTAGHAGAGGVNVPINLLDEFKTEVNTGLQDVNFESTIYYQLELNGDHITKRTIQDIMRFTRISGKDMWEAKFKVTNLMVLGKSLMGKTKNTVKINCDGLDLMKFRTTEEWFNNLTVDDYDTIEAVGTLNINRWFNWSKNNRGWVESNQMFMEDFEVVG